MKFEKNQRYLYGSFAHQAAPDETGEYYCRSRHFLMHDNYALCRDCPLFGGTSITETGEMVPECWYFDLDTESSGEVFERRILSPIETYQKEDALMKLGYISFFPEYLSDDESIRHFGIIENALIFAGKKHHGQVRKGSNIPYIGHPIEVAMIVAKMSGNPEMIAAAALHDTLEDTDTTYDELVKEFGYKVADLVNEESEDKRPEMDKSNSWKIRKQETIDHAKAASYEAKVILLADKLSNMRQTALNIDKIGDRVWERFNVTDPALHEWYHRGILKSMKELEDTEQYHEYKMLLEKVFGKK
jgi:myo-inositol-1(or 4)-monophosphatase